jgi:hypothetical protein
MMTLLKYLMAGVGLSLMPTVQAGTQIEFEAHRFLQFSDVTNDIFTNMFMSR